MSTATFSARRISTLPFLLVAAVGVLLAVDLAGGLWAARSGVNTWSDAWGGHALLAAPLPMVAVQMLLTWGSLRASGRLASVAAALLATACLISVASGFFDGGLGHAALKPGMRAYQVFLLVVTGLVGLLAAARVVQLSLRGEEYPTPAASASSTDPHAAQVPASRTP